MLNVVRLNVAIKPFMLNVVMVSVVMLSVAAPKILPRNSFFVTQRTI
jgi:hypothetical protein